MNEQKINVKSTYVATVKKDVVNNALSFYTDKKEENIFSTGGVFPEDNKITPEVPVVDITPKVVENEPVSEPVVENKDTVIIPDELKIDNTIPVEEPAVSSPLPETAEAPQPVQVEELPGIPNLNVLNPTPVEPVSQEQPVAPTAMPIADSIPQPMPSVPPVEVPGPIPSPSPEPVIAQPVNDNFANIESLVNQVNQQVNEEPIRFDASHETNLLGALSEGQSNMGNIPVTPENLNVVREFGVDEPVVTGDNGSVPAGKPATGFVNSKILLILVIIFFLASCVFLGYEIYKYVTLPK